jgi:hypothetical protein
LTRAGQVAVYDASSKGNALRNDKMATVFPLLPQHKMRAVVGADDVF